MPRTLETYLTIVLLIDVIRAQAANERQGRLSDSEPLQMTPRLYFGEAF